MRSSDETIPNPRNRNPFNLIQNGLVRSLMPQVLTGEASLVIAGFDQGGRSSAFAKGPAMCVLTPHPGPLPVKGRGSRDARALRWVGLAPRSVRGCRQAHSGSERGVRVHPGSVARRAPCPVTSHLGNSQVIGNQGRHPFVVQAGQKSSREVTGRNARTKSGGFSPLARSKTPSAIVAAVCDRRKSGQNVHLFGAHRAPVRRSQSAATAGTVGQLSSARN